MKIKKILLYGFGRHENLEISLDSGVNLLYGPNEAGKTTIQQAILHILFGFPQKNQAELRYEPKSGVKYGGCLYMEDVEFGDWMIERVRGKSAGDVTVQFADGRTAGEEALHKLLRGYDRQAFEAIFAFSLFQLQGLEKMNEDELSRTLLASGLTGFDTLWKVEAKMEKEAAGLFKKSGKLPLLNQKLAEIKELEQEIKKEQLKLQTFEPLTERQLQMEEQLAALRMEEQQLYRLTEELMISMQFVPLQQQKQQLADRLADLSGPAFPADGIRRYETLTGKLSELESAKTRQADEVAKWEKLLHELRTEEERLELERLAAQEAEWHRLRNETRAAGQEIQLLESKLQQLRGRAGVGEEQQSAIRQLDVSVQRERKLEPILRSLTEAEQQLHAVNRMIAEAENERHELEQQKNGLIDNGLTDDELRRLQQLPDLKSRLGEAKAALSFSGRQSSAVPLVLIVAGLGFAVFGLIQSQWLLAAAGILAAGAGVWLRKQQPGRQEELEDFIRKNEPLAAELDRLAIRHEDWQREERQIHSGIVKLESKLDRLAAEVEEIHLNKQRLTAELKRLTADDPVDLTWNVQESFRLLRELQDTYTELQSWRERLEAGGRRITEWMRAAETLLGPLSEDTLYEKVRQELQRQKELHGIQRSVIEMKRQLEETEMLFDSVRNDIADIFGQAGAEDEEQFYAAYERERESLLLKRQLAEVEVQLSSYGARERETRTMPELEHRRGQASDRLLAIREEAAAFVDELAKVSHEISELGSSGTYSSLLQLFEVRKAELQELAGQWLRKSAVAEAIRQTMDGWRQKQLPAVLELANEWFSRLTGRRYRLLGLTEEGKFHAVREGGQRFMIHELSQATKEQAYLSLRLALASTLSARAPFPILMDDPFVHFDNKRLSRMIEIMKELQPSHQFLYFTCHEDIESKWAGELHKLTIGHNVKERANDEKATGTPSGGISRSILADQAGDEGHHAAGQSFHDINSPG